MFRYKKILLAIMVASLAFLAGCKQSFNPYRHMHLIMTATGYDDLANNYDFIIQHTEEGLQPYITSLFSVITGSHTDEIEIYHETSGNAEKLLGCYVQRSPASTNVYYAYFEYTNDKLVKCHIYPFSIYMPL